MPLRLATTERFPCGAKLVPVTLIAVIPALARALMMVGAEPEPDARSGEEATIRPKKGRESFVSRFIGFGWFLEIIAGLMPQSRSTAGVCNPCLRSAANLVGASIAWSPSKSEERLRLPQQKSS